MFELIFPEASGSSFLFWFDSVFVALLGLCLGSFSSAIIYRVPLGISWVKKGARSACSSCGHTLDFFDLIPLFSWLLNRGRCRHCKQRVSPLYPALELISAVLCLFVYFVYAGGLAEKFLIVASVPFLLALIVIDIRHKILPNHLVLIVGTLGILFVFAQIFAPGEDFEVFFLYHLCGAFIFGGFAYFLGVLMQKLLKKQALGMGDVKFFAVAGLWLGVLNLGVFCLLAGVFGVLFSLFWMWRFKENHFPFGPALIASFFVILTLDGSLFWQKALESLGGVLG